MHHRSPETPWAVFTAGLACAIAAAAARPAPAAEAVSTVEVRGGSIVFDVGTNVPALGVHGKSTALQGQASLRQETNEVVLERVEAVVPVKTLVTGIGQRDEHMRKHIFTASDGQTPDVRFVAEKVTCPAPAGGETSCAVNGQLSLRGTPRPFGLTLKVKSDGSAFKASGDGRLKLSDWGIERPSQLGVKTEDEVKVHLDFTASPSTLTARAGRRE